MRCYQDQGFTDYEAVADWLDKNCVKEKRIHYVCEKCRHEDFSMVVKIFSQHQEDMFYGDGPILHEYQTLEGKVVKEVVQEAPWSSGPMGFVCLEVDGKRMFEWTEEQKQERML